MARKVFMSVLGTSLYNECSYYQKDKENSIKSRFVQEATIRMMCQDWKKDDQIIIFTTKQSFTENYDLEIEKRYDRIKNQEVPYTGLEKIFTDLKLQPPFRNVPIKDGNTEEEIWDIFETIYGELKEDDEIYFDITHSFRYLPMLLMILLSYSEFLKKTKVRSITYGNYEISKQNEGFAPIMDLMPLVLLKDWSLAASNFDQFGDVSLISELCQQSLKPILQLAQGSDEVAKAVNAFSKDLPGFIATIKTCRGPEINSGEKAIKLEKRIAKVEETSLVPFNPIFTRIKNQIHRFASGNNLKNGLTSVEWCISNGLIQQGLTMLQETITSLICENENLKITNKAHRAIVNSTFSILLNNTNESDWKGDCASTEENTQLTKKLLKNPLLISLSKDFSLLTDVRNDINHFGMRDNPSKAENFERNLKEIFYSVLTKTTNL